MHNAVILILPHPHHDVHNQVSIRVTAVHLVSSGYAF